ncbi:hypothetical protein HCH_04443 [Hahella chejuensis KCTC 2396]|uniref:Uncharacterized protein n=1 Tax=Hahella chejuensis (strain KCTC 2396) TaxID=349521 RepID=Q2SDX7_HAHCH|nr:hypothetical protein HCH_04443 [Hahella chejuensis KCTC 2396]
MGPGVGLRDSLNLAMGKAPFHINPDDVEAERPVIWLIPVAGNLR